MADFPVVDPDKSQQKISALLVGNGFYEIVTNSLTKPEYVEDSNYLNPENDVVILNKLSEDLAVLRQTMLYSGLEAIAYNLNRKQSNLKLFEFGKTYQKLKSGYQEHNHLCLYMTGNKSKPHWSVNEMNIQFHDLYNYVALVLRRMLEKSISGHPDHQDPFQYGLKLSIDENIFGKLGKVNPAILKRIDINEEIYYADLNWDLLLSKTNDNIVFEEVSKFPEVRRDLSLLIDKDISFEQIKEVAEQRATYLVKDISVFDVYEGKNIGENKKAYAVSFLIQDKKKTLTDKIIDKVMNRLMNAFENELKATIRK
jgi:phenylalanyl-tRNA synthetase beta chain